MNQRMVKVMSAFAALSIAATGVSAMAGTAVAAAPKAQVAQAQDETGVLIVSVQKDGPAAKAGLRRGDIVLKVNDTGVNDAQALREALGKFKPGDEVQIQVARGDGEVMLKIKLGDADGRAILGVTPFSNAPAVPPAPVAPRGQPSQGQQSQPGQRGQQMDPKQAEELRKQMEEQFAAMSKTRVAEVTKDSPAAKAGLKANDIILSVDGTTLDAQNALADVIGGLKPGDEVTLKIERDGKEQELKIALGENPDKKGVAFLGIHYAPSFNIQGMPGGFQLPFEMPGQPGQRGNGNAPFQMPEMPNLPKGMQAGMVAIGDVVKDSPAAKVGLKQGDVIIAANDKDIQDPAALVDLVKASKPGDEITLSVTRQGEDKPLEITVTLGENPDKKGAAFMGVSVGSFMRMQQQPGSNSQG